MERVSVIVPVYKVEQYLDKCIKSVLEQTYQDIELILVDDGSPDNCGNICDDYARRDSRVRVIHKENGGLSSARNAGLEIASGAYIMFVDSDDYIALDMVEKLYQRMQQDDSDMVVCGGQRVDEKGNLLCSGEGSHTKNGTYTADEFYPLLFLCFVEAWGKLYKRTAFEDIRFPVGKLHEDVFVTYKTVEKCAKISVLTEKLYYYLQRDNSIMHARYHKGRLDETEALLNALEFLMERKLANAIELICVQTICIFSQASVKLDFKDKAGRERYDVLKSEFDALWKKNRLQKAFSRKTSMHFLLYGISPRLHHFVATLILNLRKKERYEQR